MTAIYVFKRINLIFVSFVFFDSDDNEPRDIIRRRSAASDLARTVEDIDVVVFNKYVEVAVNGKLLKPEPVSILYTGSY